MRLKIFIVVFTIFSVCNSSTKDFVKIVGMAMELILRIGISKGVLVLMEVCAG